MMSVLSCANEHPKHIRDLRETVNALVGTSCGHAVPGAYLSVLDLWKEQRFAFLRMA